MLTFCIQHSTFNIPRSPLELKTKPTTEGEVSHFVVVVDPVIRELRDESRPPRDREVAVDAAGKSVVRLSLISALHRGNRKIGQRSALSIQTHAREQTGRAERFREAIVDQRIDVL